MRRVWLALAACSAPAPSTHAPIGNTKVEGPSVEVLAQIDRALHWYTVTLEGVRETRTVSLPSQIKSIVWLGHDPTFELQNPDFSTGGVAIVTRAGLEMIPMPPASTWVVEPAPQGMTHLDSPSTHLFAKDDALWLGRCEWVDQGGIYNRCTSWVNARIRPTPVVTNTDDYDPLVLHVEIAKPAVRVEPSSSIHVALVPDRERPRLEPATPRMKLVCTANGKTLEDPPPGDPDEVGGSDFPPYAPGRGPLVWLSTEPPIFEIGAGRCVPCPSIEIYEGCAKSSRFESVTLGPSEVMAFEDSSPGDKHITFWWRGRELGTLDRVNQLAFVPAK